MTVIDFATRAAKAQAVIDAADMPTIIVGNDLMRVGTEACAALARDPDVYQRDGELVRIVRLAEPEVYRGREIAAEGTPQIRSMPLATLRERLSAVATWSKHDARSDKLREVSPPNGIVAAVAARAEWPGIRPLVGIAEAPIVRPDLTVATEPGYDRATGYVYCPSCDVGNVPDMPTQADAAAALALLAEPFADFPYRSEADRYVAVAAVLTLLARPAILGAVPGFVLDASTRGSGKSLQTDGIATIATGRAASRMTWPPDEAELEKVLGAYALRGAALAPFDNVSSGFGGAPLDKVLTAIDTVDLRILGRSEIPTLRWRAVVLATGNNVEVRGDTTRRVLVSRLEPSVERPEDRTDFRHPDLLGWVRAERPRLVAAALTIIRAFAVAGRPACGCSTWGSFEAWSSIIPPAIVYAGGVDPMLCRIGTDDGADGDRATLLAILDGLSRLTDSTGSPMTARSIVASLYPPRRPGEPPPDPDGYDGLRDAIEGMTSAKPGSAPNLTAVGKALAKLRGRYVGGQRLERDLDRNGVAVWHVEGVRR